jgi:hypothetical protein
VHLVRSRRSRIFLVLVSLLGRKPATTIRSALSLLSKAHQFEAADDGSPSLALRLRTAAKRVTAIHGLPDPERDRGAARGLLSTAGTSDLLGGRRRRGSDRCSDRPCRTGSRTRSDAR